MCGKYERSTIYKTKGQKVSKADVAIGKIFKLYAIEERINQRP
jgi:hypothetical protein